MNPLGEKLEAVELADCHGSDTFLVMFAWMQQATVEIDRLRTEVDALRQIALENAVKEQ